MFSLCIETITKQKESSQGTHKYGLHSRAQYSIRLTIDLEKIKYMYLTSPGDGKRKKNKPAHIPSPDSDWAVKLSLKSRTSVIYHSIKHWWGENCNGSLHGYQTFWDSGPCYTFQYYWTHIVLLRTHSFTLALEYVL